VPKTVAEANLEISKLDTLARESSMSVMEFIDAYALESMSPGICMNPDCDYTTEVGLDERAGYCPSCQTAMIRSGIVLAGLI
jgi:hypothetical protein